MFLFACFEIYLLVIGYYVFLFGNWSLVIGNYFFVWLLEFGYWSLPLNRRRRDRDGNSFRQFVGVGDDVSIRLVNQPPEPGVPVVIGRQQVEIIPLDDFMLGGGGMGNRTQDYAP
jgi:hypothetical protein